MDRKRPSGLLTVIIVGCVLGGLGTCAGLQGLAAPLMQGFSRDILQASSGGNEQVYEQQLAMQERVEAVTEAWRVPLLSQALLNLIASLALLVGAILLMKWRPNGPSLVTAAAVGGIVTDLAGGILGTVVQLETSAIMQESMVATMTADGAAPPGAERTMEAIMSASMGVGICMLAGWALVKLGFYVFTLVYLRKPAVRALFTG